MESDTTAQLASDPRLTLRLVGGLEVVWTQPSKQQFIAITGLLFDIFLSFLPTGQRRQVPRPLPAGVRRVQTGIKATL